MTDLVGKLLLCLDAVLIIEAQDRFWIILVAVIAAVLFIVAHSGGVAFVRRP